MEPPGHRVALQIRRIDRTLEESLVALFREIRSSPDQTRFHPHPFDDETAHWIANYTGQDLYYGAMCDVESELVGYGMLRGWDEGYTVPSLGIIIRQSTRGKGLSKPFMSFMHDAARARGCAQVRLKVYRDNVAAVHLYENLGYVFRCEGDEQLVGTLDL